LRVKELDPDNLSAQLNLIEACLLRRRVDDALAQIADIHAREQKLGLSSTNQVELLVAEAAARLSRKDLGGAENAVHKVLSKFPDDTDLLGAATRVYMDFHYFSNALETIDLHLKLSPDNAGVLFNRGYACLELHAYDQAINSLTRLINMGTNNPTDLYELALFVRARAYLGSEKLDEAQADFEVIKKAHPTAFQPYFGLGEVAYHRKDTNAAIQNYQIALANTATNSVDANTIISRLKDLRPGSL